MAYLPLRNYKYDSGPHRIQSGPDHEGYILVRNGIRATGADNGIIVDGTPLSGVAGSGQRWGYDANWRYVPTSSPAVSGRLTLTRRQPSGTLGAYTYTRISTPSSTAGVKVVSSVESDIGFRNLNKRKSVYYGGACPDNQNYSPFNTPGGNTAAEGKTGGGVTHQLYESPLLTNVLGSQGTPDRSEWQYNSPIYCSVFTEAVRSERPGLISTVVRSTYRGGSLSYLANYGNVVLGAQQFSGGGGGGGGEEVYEEEVDGGFEEWEEEDYAPCTPYVPELPYNSNEYEDPATVYVGDVLSPSVLTGEVNDTLWCEYSSVDWYNDCEGYLESGDTYTVSPTDIGCGIYYQVNYEDVVLASPITNAVQHPLPLPPCAINVKSAVVGNVTNISAWPSGMYDPCGPNQMRFEAVGIRFNPNTCARESFYSVVDWTQVPIPIGQVAYTNIPNLGGEFCEGNTIQTYDDTVVYLTSMLGTPALGYTFLRTQRGLNNTITWSAAVRPVYPSGVYVRQFPQPGQSAYGHAAFIPTG